MENRSENRSTNCKNQTQDRTSDQSTNRTTNSSQNSAANEHKHPPSTPRVPTTRAARTRLATPPATAAEPLR